MIMQKQKWYFRTESLVIAFLVAGPLMLPLVWYNDKFTPKKKITVTGLVILSSIAMTVFFYKSFVSILNHYKDILSQLG